TVKLILRSHRIALDQNTRPQDDELNDYYEIVENFWNTVLEGLQPYKDAIRDSSLISPARKDDQPFALLFKPIGQLALFRGLTAATQDNRLNLIEAVKRANKIDWRIEAEIWTNILVAPSRSMLRGEQPPVQGGKLIHYLIASDKMTKEEIANFQQEYNLAKALNIDEPLPKSIPESLLSDDEI
ncbi:MAG: hypothetical protein ACK58Z_14865, partial [Pseudanabaena sp.]